MTAVSDKGLSARYLLLPFSRFLADPEVTEVAVNRPGVAWTETSDGWAAHDAPELTLRCLLSAGIACASYAGENVAFESTEPILSVTLPAGERAQFVMPPACRDGTVSVTIRKPSFEVKGIGEFEREGFFDYVKEPGNSGNPDEALFREYLSMHEGKDVPGNRARFLSDAVRARKNIVIAGATGSGKTTFMKALMQEIPRTERLVTIEDVPELLYGLPDHGNQVNLFYPSEAKDGDAVTPAALIRSCLRMKPDRILLAELRGPETYDYCSACLSGHRGSITSCHAGSCEEVFDYLALRVRQSKSAGTMTGPEIRELLEKAVDVVVHIRNDRGIGRHVSEIAYPAADRWAEKEARG